MKRGNSIRLHDCSRSQKNCAGSVDGICDLPDSILCHILSFLPTKNAVDTHLLSRRWKFLWTMANNLEFRCHDDKIDQYVKFVNYVLLLHKPGYLNKLSLTWYYKCIPYHVNTWISAAVLRNVHELFVHVTLSTLPIQVQRSMFSCESLRTLELDCDICISREIAISLPRLESLRLISVSFQSEETLCELLGGCPVLKYLFIYFDIRETMKYCQLDIGNLDEFRCIISSDSLKRLELRARGNPIGTPVCSVQLDAPLLEYIELDAISRICIHQSFISLVEANIQLVYLVCAFEDENYFNSVVKAFRTFDCVKTLKLSPQFIKALNCATIEMETRFNSLTRLEVYQYKGWNWRALREFITLADCLEVLTIHMYMDDGSSSYIEEETDLVPSCLPNSLRTVSIDPYHGFEHEAAAVEYILKHGSVLEVMHIHFRGMGLETSYKVVKEISKLPRKSPVCKVEFHDHSGI